MEERLKKFFEEKAIFDEEQKTKQLKIVEEATEKLFEHILSVARNTNFSTKVKVETSEIVDLCDENVFPAEAVLMLVNKYKGQIKSSRNGSTYTFELIQKKDD